MQLVAVQSVVKAGIPAALLFARALAWTPIHNLSKHHTLRITCDPSTPTTSSLFNLLSPSLRAQSLPSFAGRHITVKMSSSFAAATASQTSITSKQSNLRYIDAGANLLDEMYQGNYHGNSRHEPDLGVVLQRAYENGVHRIISMAGTPEESKLLLDLCKSGVKKVTKKEDTCEAISNSIDGNTGNSGNADCREEVLLFGTVGVHPTRCAQVFAEKSTSASPSDNENSDTSSWVLKSEEERHLIIQQLIDLARKGKRSGNVVAIGECGLDYARLHFCPKDVQKIGFRAQLEVACDVKLPLYLHNRDSGEDLEEILLEYRERLVASQGKSGDDGGNNANSIRGVVHSFDESLEIAHKLLSLGLYIGINGCSLKTPENLSVVKELPLDKIILETDCPWCDIRPSHAGHTHVRTTFPSKKEKQYDKEFCVKNRTEPCHVAQVAEVVAGIKGVDVREVVDICCGRNVYDLFGNLEKNDVTIE